MSVKVEVWGDYACFTRPEMKVERVSYDVMTPSAARGLLEAIYWHPGMRWQVDRIFVLSPIKFTNIRRNEVNSKAQYATIKSAMKGDKDNLLLSTANTIRPRASLVLQDIHYVIEAHFELTDKAAESDNQGKFCDIMRRRLEKGQCYHQPCFGCREFPASFRGWSGGEIQTAYPDEEKDLGFMLYDLDYTDRRNIRPMFFRAAMKNGVINVPAPDSGEVLR